MMMVTQRAGHALMRFSLVNTAAGAMEDDLMFSMEEVEGSAKRPPVQSSAPRQRTSSLSDANASDDDDTDDSQHFICPILDENSAKDICHYLKNLVNNHQLSNSLPKSSFTYQVGHRLTPCQKRWEVLANVWKTAVLHFAETCTFLREQLFAL